MSVEDHPATSLLREILVLVLGIHVVLAEGTVVVVELNAVQRQQLCEELGLDLLLRIIQGVPVHEVAFLLRVGMQIDVKT